MADKRRRSRLLSLVLFGMLAGLLIWTKLRLVSELPRTAYAVPEQESSDVQGPSRPSHD